MSIEFNDHNGEYDVDLDEALRKYQLTERLNALESEGNMMKRKLSYHDTIARIRDMLYPLNPQERNSILSELYHWNFYENERHNEHRFQNLSYEFVVNDDKHMKLLKTRLLNQKEMLSSIEYADKILLGNAAKDFLTEKDVKIE